MLPQYRVNSRSHRPWRHVLGRAAWALAALGAAALAVGSGCVVVDSNGDDGGYYDPPTTNDPPAVDSVAIDVDDPGQELTTDLGEGVGIFVEYEGAGRWKLWTACDTKQSGVSCGFDLYADLPNVAVDTLDELEETDYVDVGEGSAHASFDTASDSDGVTLTGEPGASLRLEVLLDNADAKDFVFWASDGVVNSGAPTNPTAFVPNGA